MNRAIAGFTLIELLISISIFTGVLGTFFSVISSVRRSEQFRDHTATLTQQASYGFEPLVRSIKNSQGVELKTIEGKDYCLRGFYVQNGSTLIRPTVIEEGNVLTTLSIVSSRSNGVNRKVLKRNDYTLSSESRLAETVYQAPYSVTGTSCESINWGVPVETRFLTSQDTVVRRLVFRSALPIKADLATGRKPVAAPFVTIDYVLDHPNGGRPGIAPMSLTTTVVPSFIYGVIDESL